MVWIFLISVVPYLLLMLLIASYQVSIRTFIPSSASDLNVSVIISCKNEEDNLPIILKDLADQDYPDDLLEVVIVDDNSTDRTPETARSFTKLRNLRVLNNPGKGKKSAIRSGIGASTGSLIITTDADCRAGNKWISTIVSFYRENKPGMVIGGVSLQGKGGFISKFQELEFLALQGITAGTAAAGSPVMCNGANLAFSRDAYSDSSGSLHDEIPSGDDMFLMMSMKRKGKYEISWLEAQDSMVTTFTKGSISSLMKQRARWLSKIKAYDDPFTVITAIVTFVTIIGILTMFTGIFINEKAIIFLLAAIVIKSIPDIMILNSVAGKRKVRSLLIWFIPSQILYPFYVLAVFLFSLAGGKRWK